MNDTKQKYALYRDNELLVDDVPSLAVIGSFAMKDARNEHAHGRPALYLIHGTHGFRRSGRHFKGRLRWEEGKLKLNVPLETGVLA